MSDALAAMRTGRPHSSRPELAPPWRLRAEEFAGAAFHVVLAGSCTFTSTDGSSIDLAIGDVVFLPHGGAHELRDERAATLLCGAYLLDRARSHPMFDELPDVIHLPARVGRHPALRAVLDLLGEELDRRRPGADAAVSALLDMLLLYMLRAWFDELAASHPVSGWAAALADPASAAALRDIHHDPARRWTVDELAARAGLSRAAFARRFTTLVGRPPLTYLTWWRMTTAARLLRESDAPLRVVAQRTGYTSEYSFAKAFKREFGTAPGAYRFCRGGGPDSSA